jgi:hypothetical protein
MFEFYWKVPEVGFEWVNTKTAETREKGEFLVERASAVAGQLATSYRNYPAFKKTSLFKTFADAEPSKEGILAFANQYGFLGSDAVVPIHQPVPGERNTYYSVPGERAEFWQREIRAMKHAVQIWEAAKICDAKFLSIFIKWHGSESGWQANGVSYYRPQDVFEECEKSIYLGSPEPGSEITSLFTPGDPVLPARFALHRLVNAKFKQHSAIPKLFWDRTRRGLTETLQIAPGSLISALWIQFAKAIEGNREYRQCEECTGWYEVSVDHRSGARFCSNACRFKAYRVRQKTAKGLREKGVSLKDIAAQLKSDVETVRGWTGNQQKGK